MESAKQVQGTCFSVSLATAVCLTGALHLLGNAVSVTKFLQVKRRKIGFVQVEMTSSLFCDLKWLLGMAWKFLEMVLYKPNQVWAVLGAVKGCLTHHHSPFRYPGTTPDSVGFVFQVVIKEFVLIRYCDRHIGIHSPTISFLYGCTRKLYFLDFSLPRCYCVTTSYRQGAGGDGRRHVQARVLKLPRQFSDRKSNV